MGKLCNVEPSIFSLQGGGRDGVTSSGFGSGSVHSPHIGTLAQALPYPLPCPWARGCGFQNRNSMLCPSLQSSVTTTKTSVHSRHTSRVDVGHVTNLFQQVSNISESEFENKGQILLLIIMFKMSGFYEYLQQTGNNGGNILICCRWNVITEFVIDETYCNRNFKRYSNLTVSATSMRSFNLVAY